MLRQGRSWSGFERNCVFLNTNGSEEGDGRFATVSAVSGVDFLDDSRAIAHVDWDHDGDLDFWMSNRNAPRLRLMRNDSGSSNGFVQIGVTGNGTDTNRNAVGARVTVTLKEIDGSTTPTVLNQTLYAGDGFISQGTRWLHFGLGPNGEIEKVSVRWPNQTGDVEVFEGVQANGMFELVQGSGTAVAANRDRGQLALKPSGLSPAPLSDVHRIPLVFNLPVPIVSYSGFDGQKNQLPTGKGQATLVNLWSSTCAPCLKELKEFSARYDELKNAGIRVVATSIDAFDPNIEDPLKDSRETAKRIGMPFNVGMADPKLVDQLRKLHNQMIVLETPLPLPTSFLIDREGNLDVIYKGPITVDTLLADAKLSDKNLVARLHRSAAFPGRVIDDPALLAPLALEGSIVHQGIGRDLMDNHRIAEAIDEYKKAIAHAPHSPFAHNACGVALSSYGKLDEAITHFRKAVELDSSRVQFQVNLGQALNLTRQHKEAESILTKVVSEFSGHSDAWFQLGLSRLRLGNNSEAQANLEKAIECNPKHGQAHFTLGGMYLGQADLKQARRHFEATLKIEPNQPVVLVNLAAVAMQEQNMPEAEQQCRKAIEQDPGYADAHFFLGMVLQSQGRVFDARKSYEATLQCDPAHTRARQALQRL